MNIQAGGNAERPGGAGGFERVRTGRVKRGGGGLGMGELRRVEGPAANLTRGFPH